MSPTPFMLDIEAALRFGEVTIDHPGLKALALLAALIGGANYISHNALDIHEKMLKNEQQTIKNEMARFELNEKKRKAKPS